MILGVLCISSLSVLSIASYILSNVTWQFIHLKFYHLVISCKISLIKCHLYKISLFRNLITWSATTCIISLWIFTTYIMLNNTVSLHYITCIMLRSPWHFAIWSLKQCWLIRYHLFDVTFIISPATIPLVWYLVYIISYIISVRNFITYTILGETMPLSWDQLYR